MLATDPGRPDEEHRVVADLKARATVGFKDLRPGDVVQVDPSDPYIAKLLHAGWLVPVEPSADEQGSTSVNDEA